MDEINPYAPPASDIARDRIVTEIREGLVEGRGVWRDGKLLVMTKGATLPMRCLKCNAPATYRLYRSLSWHASWLFGVIFFAGPLIYVIVAMFARKTAKTHFPLCEEHRARRTRNLWIATGVIIAGCVSMYFGAVSDDERIKLLIGVGFLLLLSGLIAVLLISRVVPTQKIDDARVWLKGICPAYLGELPSGPYSDRAIDEEARNYLTNL